MHHRRIAALFVICSLSIPAFAARRHRGRGNAWKDSEEPLAAALSVETKRLAVLYESKKIQIWDLTTRSVVKRIDGLGDEVRAIAISRDGALVAAADTEAVRIWNVADATEKAKLTDLKEAQALLFSPNGAVLYVGGGAEKKGDEKVEWNKKVRVVNVDDGKVTATWEGHEQAVHSLSMTTDGGTIVSSDAAGKVKIWRAGDGTELNTHAGHSDAVDSVAVSPNGQMVVSASRDGTLKVWPMEGKRYRSILSGHDGAVYAVAISPDGRRIASGGNDKTVRVWDAKSGKQVKVWKGHKKAVHIVSFLANGKLLTAAYDKVYRTWSVP